MTEGGFVGCRSFLLSSALTAVAVGIASGISIFLATDGRPVGGTSPAGRTYAIAISNEPAVVDWDSDDPSYDRVRSRLELVRDGRVVRTLEETSRAAVAGVAWSHDRSAVAWTESGLGAYTQLLAARPDGGGKRLIATQVTSFAWSPRGHELVVTWVDGTDHGYVDTIDVLSGASRRLRLKGAVVEEFDVSSGESSVVENARDFTVLRWLPSGLIVWKKTGSPNPHYYSILVTDAEGRGERLVGSGDDRGDFGAASLTADGLNVVEVTKADAGRSIVELHEIASGRTWRLTLRGWPSAVSPDGRRLLIAARLTPTGAGGTLAHSLVDVTAGTSRRLQLPRKASPLWLPDGRIAFTTRYAGRERLVAVTVTTRARRALVTLRAGETMSLDAFSLRPVMLTPTSDGRRLAFVADGPRYARVVSIGVDGAQPRTLATLTRRSGDDTLSVGNRSGWFLDWELRSDGGLTLASPWEVVETRDEPGANPRLLYRPPAGYAVSSYARR